MEGKERPYSSYCFPYFLFSSFSLVLKVSCSSKRILPARLFVCSYVNRVLRLRLRGETDKSSSILFASFFFKFCGILRILFLNCVTVRRRLDNSKTKKNKDKRGKLLGLT